MYFYGSFLTQLGETVTVHIVTKNSRAKQVEIGDDESGVFFTTDPVEIESSVNDTFDHLLRSQATIRLLTRDFIQDFFCTSCMDAVVNIFKGGKCIFAGFIEPQTYSQGYNEVYDELEISCIDALSALQYSKYRDVGRLGVVYDVVRAEAEHYSFGAIIGNIINGICANIDLTGAGGISLYYDGSKAITDTADRYDIFNRLAISELLFLGNEEDDVWMQDKVIEAIFKYLNLHIIQDGLNFFIFSWETIKGQSGIIWKDLITGKTITTSRGCVEIALSNTAADDTTISIGEVFNQILLTCKIKSIDHLIKSPLDKDDLVSPYSNKQKYMTEYSSDGNGNGALEAFYHMTHDEDTDFGGGEITDWYIQVKNNSQWEFPEPGTGENLIDKYCADNTNQQSLPNRMTSSPSAALVSFGKVVNKTDHKDNSLISKIDMTDYLVVSVNGNGEDDLQKAYPTGASILNSAPCAVYRGGTSGAIYSPPIDEATNYIVFSGKVVLNPLMDFSWNYKPLHTEVGPWDVLTLFRRTVPSRNNTDGRFYTQKYYKCATPFSAPVWDEDTDRGLIPFTDTGPLLYDFKYSAIGDGTDKISKVAALACMLIIGDKCVVETGTDGQISDFQWRTYKTREQCASDDEYYQQCFTIGFDPKIGDKLIGTDFSFQNNIDYTVGIDAEGIAIPIRKSDNLSGQVKFMILGPVNSMWDVITRRHRTWFRREKWSENAIPLLSHVSNIYLQNFEVKIYSDNGLINNTEDNDLIYMSDTHETFVNRKDDLSFDITSALTNDESRRLGISNTISLSTPLDLSSGGGVLYIYDCIKQQSGKPEQQYVDSYYKEYHKPRVLMTQKIEDRESNVSLFNHYQHPAMIDKLFYVQGISRNLIEGYAELTMKEVWND